MNETLIMIMIGARGYLQTMKAWGTSSSVENLILQVLLGCLIKLLWEVLVSQRSSLSLGL